MKCLARVLVAAACLFQVKGTALDNCSCVENDCFSVIHERADFPTARKTCKERNGHLAEVRSEKDNDAIFYLLNNTKGDFWIGLEFVGEKCSDVLSGLKGYKWTTGDNTTEFTNWKRQDKVCSSQCVSISSDLKWREGPCQLTLDGYICESIRRNTCSPLAAESDSVVLYSNNASDRKELCSVSPGSIALSVPSKLKYVCLNENQWIQAPWGCDFEKGGCDYACAAYNQGVQCRCPPGTTLHYNNISCVAMSQDPCLGLQCEHFCVFGASCECRQGYQLDDDGRRCRDINECADKRLCKNMTCVNTVGSFECTCPPGFKAVGNKCKDINECASSPCEHNCINTEGSYSCQCSERYKRDPEDFTKCVFYCDDYECPAECDPNNHQQCHCPDGFVADERDTGTFCMDIDECEINYCDQVCENTIGSYKCLCNEGFYLEEQLKCKKRPTDYLSTPVTTHPPPRTSSVSSGGLFGIIFCVMLVILLLVLLVYLKCHSRWIFRGINNQNEDMKDLQEVTAEATKPFPSSQIKLDTC